MLQSVVLSGILRQPKVNRYRVDGVSAPRMLNKNIFSLWRSDCYHALMMMERRRNSAFVKNELRTVREDVFDP